MERHEQFWQQFTKSGDPKAYLAYRQSRPADDVNIKKRHADN